MSVIGLISKPGKIAGGSITMHTEKGPVILSELPEEEMRHYRGSEISMIFQEPMTSLNPVFTIGTQITEAILLHQNVTKSEALGIAIETLRKVKIPAPEQRLKEYPHQFSGGMRQRVMIAMSLACNPKLLIADEPTTALDVTIQAQILDLLRQLQESEGMSILLITHDLGVIAEMADEVAVMYASKVVEQAPINDLYTYRSHPYTHGLFDSRPMPGMSRDKELYTIKGMVPSPLNFPPGCKFNPRCPYTQDRCREEEPELIKLKRHVQSEQHLTRCHFAEEIEYE